MKKIIGASFLAALTLAMLLPVARQVNATSVNLAQLTQGNPMPGGGGGGHYQGNPMPGGGGGGHYQGNPMPGGGGGGH